MSALGTCPHSAVPDPNRRLELRVGPARACLNRGTKVLLINASYNLPTNIAQGWLHSNASYHVSHIVRVDILKGTSALCRIGMSPEVKVYLGPVNDKVEGSISLKLMSRHFFLSSCENDEVHCIRWNCRISCPCIRTSHR